MEEDYKLFQLIRRNPINNCVDLSKNMIGKKSGFIYFTENFRIDFENKMANQARLQEENERLQEENKQLKEENEDLKMKIQFISKNNIDDLYEKALVKTMTKFLNNNIKEDYIPVSKIKEKYEKNKARTDCRYCNNTCDSYAVCMFCKKILEGK